MHVMCYITILVTMISTSSDAIAVGWKTSDVIAAGKNSDVIADGWLAVMMMIAVADNFILCDNDAIADKHFAQVLTRRVKSLRRFT